MTGANLTASGSTALGRGPTRSCPYWTVLWISLVAGTLDIGEDLIFNLFRGITPKMVFQFIASGLLGVKAIEMSWTSVVLGAFLHYFIAISWTAVFYMASRKLAVITRQPLASGLLYGCIVYLFMNFVVLPLSRIPHVHAAVTFASRINGVLAVVLCIGLPISLLLHWSQARAWPRAGGE